MASSEGYLGRSTYWFFDNHRKRMDRMLENAIRQYIANLLETADCEINDYGRRLLHDVAIELEDILNDDDLLGELATDYLLRE